MISASFQAQGKIEVRREQLIISVNGSKITGRLSLIIRGLILSEPADLFRGNDITIQHSSSQVTVLKLKRQLSGMARVSSDSCELVLVWAR